MWRYYACLLSAGVLLALPPTLSANHHHPPKSAKAYYGPGHHKTHGSTEAWMKAHRKSRFAWVHPKG